VEHGPADHDGQRAPGVRARVFFGLNLAVFFAGATHNSVANAALIGSLAPSSSFGMVLFSTGLAITATVTTSSGYGRLAIALVFMGAGMGLAGAPSTESIMNSLH
jgi:hypothetical protein